MQCIFAISTTAPPGTEVRCILAKPRQLTGVMSGAECAVLLRSYLAQPLRLIIIISVVQPCDINHCLLCLGWHAKQFFATTELP